MHRRSVAPYRGTGTDGNRRNQAYRETFLDPGLTTIEVHVFDYMRKTAIHAVGHQVMREQADNQTEGRQRSDAPKGQRGHAYALLFG